MSKKDRSLTPGITPGLQRHILQIILEYKPVHKVVLFGSRATSGYRKTSDIDLAIFGERWDSSDVNIVHSKLEETIPTVLKFDLVLVNTLKKKALIDEIHKGVILYEQKKNHRVV
ncbi:nucleotidyltransferase domain-containing protein [candidate division KSB1 bacterium]|nr:nucleotidyltransferase domain-containing protein [candidate division KSB1 bacterium]